MQVAHAKKVLVEQSPSQTHVAGLLIPEQARVKPMDGIVKSIGSSVKNLRVGDKVLVGWQHGGTDSFSMDGKDYWLLNEKQVLAVIE